MWVFVCLVPRVEAEEREVSRRCPAGGGAGRGARARQHRLAGATSPPRRRPPAGLLLVRLTLDTVISHIWHTSLVTSDTLHPHHTRHAAYLICHCYTSSDILLTRHTRHPSLTHVTSGNRQCHIWRLFATPRIWRSHLTSVTCSY